MERTTRRLNKVQGIAFDLEGTIVDLENLHHSAHLQAAADVGVSLSWQEALKCLPHFVGGPDEKVAAEIAALADRKVSALDILLSKQEYFETSLQNLVKLTPRQGFVEFLIWVKELGVKTVIGTVTNRMQALHFLRLSDLLQEFGEEFIVAREDVDNPKPAPDVYLETSQRLGIQAGKQLVFEDSRTGVIAASAAGCRVVAIPTVKQADYIESLYKSGAETIYPTWEDHDLRSFVLSTLESTITSQH